MSKTAFLFPGQGVQKCGMGKDFYENSSQAAKLFEKASEALGLDMKALCFEENARLDQTEYTQAALVTTYLAMCRELESRGVKPDITAGLSLGEYAAIAVAGAMSNLDAIRLVRKRGMLMQNTVPAGEGAMCAILALDEKKIEEVLNEIPDVTIANYNCPGQIVITGKTVAVEMAAARLKEAGARRTLMLNVSGPFHSPMLEPAGAALRQELEQVTFQKLQIPYVTNVNACEITDASEIPELLVRQMYSPVRWMQSMEYMLKNGVDTFVEIGPGKTLEGFLKKINRNVQVHHVSCWEDLEQICQNRK
ncbi:Malonyl CoA-acyl carrier protein transacylase [uncultured Clostridium sp.]|uniref:Malonyl CoA-acyl carrier protein transacylase n=1 Tax=Muricoprocola aceti TaxID=2981772 RepID=A0ABT2SKN6_9FIRM|nr:ACP S-malonyltransferase [Muricoprocola aceti]MCI7225999.1 ACP S-malonyltransferase [Lachnospiraceae bacterium]SCH37027.1 Malonyl CoA-acyl carrier protein transacylase [uncultured Clostridium sp.]MCU6725064.1 ACP S-malonyltransferase [Muricoprocola aceti]MDD7434964.1 ACP S-malonyltransferase [Lachnospiraceae bacterium]MDY3343051.1 ACP S-malonyltransferase [Lachnospiraceae bacterium]